ncbi:MAG: hypothetical protein ACEQSB_00325 [Undibacterium sp.]
MRTIRLLSGVTSAENYEKTIELLEKQLGDIMIFSTDTKNIELVIESEGSDPSFDRDALDSLKASMIR